MIRLRGFTLLELMIVIAIAAILLTLAVPSFRSILLTSSRADASTSLYGGLVAAHSEAIVRNQPVTVCRRATSVGTFPGCDLTGGSWINGWVAFVDTSSTSTTGPANASAVLAVGEPTDKSFVVTTNTLAALNFIQFQPNGRAVLPSVPRLQFKLCNSQNTTLEGRLIEIGLSGKVTLSACNNSGLCSCP